jgi:hypothetical protein
METAFWPAMGYLVLGCAIRTLLPYLTTWMEKMRDEGEWGILPFEPKYVATFVLAIVAYGVTLAITEGAAEGLMALTPVAIIALGYTGGDLARTGLKVFFKDLR